MRPCCGRGHLFTESNTLWRIQKGRNCPTRHCRQCLKDDKHRALLRKLALEPKWCPEDLSTWERMARNGASDAQIGCRLGRARSAIRRKRVNLGIEKQRKTPAIIRGNPVSRNPVFAFVARSEVADWYERGWRFVGFDGPLCVMQWHSEREPRWPSEM